MVAEESTPIIILTKHIAFVRYLDILIGRTINKLFLDAHCAQPYQSRPIKPLSLLLGLFFRIRDMILITQVRQEVTRHTPDGHTAC